MKMILGFVLALSFSASAFAGDCSADRFMEAIQKKCGPHVKYNGKVFGPFQGEVSDGYAIAVKKGDKEVNMRCDIEGGVQCEVDYITVVSDCP